MVGVDDFSIKHGDASSPLDDNDDDNDKQSKIKRSTDMYLKKAVLLLLYSAILIGTTLFVVHRSSSSSSPQPPSPSSITTTTGKIAGGSGSSIVSPTSSKEDKQVDKTDAEAEAEAEAAFDELQRQQQKQRQKHEQQQKHGQEQEHQLPEGTILPHKADHSEIWHLHTAHPLLQYLTAPQRTDDDYWIYQDTILAQVVQEADLFVRQRKRQHGVIMETDPEGQKLIKNLQALTKQILLHRYNWAPDKFHTFRVCIEVLLPKTVPDYDPVKDLETHMIVVQLAPKDLVPCSVFYMLEIIRTFERATIHRNAGHVLQVDVQSLATKGHISMPFQEYNPEFPHKKFTTGFAGRPRYVNFFVVVLGLFCYDVFYMYDASPLNHVSKVLDGFDRGFFFRSLLTNAIMLFLFFISYHTHTHAHAHTRRLDTNPYTSLTITAVRDGTFRLLTTRRTTDRGPNRRRIRTRRTVFGARSS